MAYDYNAKAEEFKAVTSEMISTYCAKNQDYGDSFATMTEDFGWRYPVIHLTEKLARIRSILVDHNGDNAVPDETARDSLLDLANYAVMTIIELDRKTSHR